MTIFLEFVDHWFDYFLVIRLVVLQITKKFAKYVDPNLHSTSTFDQ